MQKKKETKLVKQIIIFIILAILLLLIIFAEDIIKLANKNKVGLAENIPNEAIEIEANIPVISAGMIPIKWNGENWIIKTAEDKDWYDYKNGKPAYIMLNDGYYQSELIRDMNGKALADENVGNDALVVPDNPNNNPSIFVWIPSFAINENGSDIKYIKDIQNPEEGWTKPEMFTYKQTNETYPDFLLTGLWLEKDVDNSYSTKITQMNKEESIYGFIKNTIAVSSDQTSQNEIENYITNTVGNDALVVPFDDITNPKRIILHIINQNHQDPIKAFVSYNKNTALITAQVTYSKYEINKIILENEYELNFTKTNGIIVANTSGIDLEDGINIITIIDNKGNTKELQIQVTSYLYATYYTDGTLAFGKSTNPIPGKTVSARYGDISGKTYGPSNSPWYSIRTNIRTVEFVDKVSPINTNWWFNGCTNLTAINKIENLNTSDVTDMSSMFSGCSGLILLDLSHFNTSNVTTMKYMFQLCSSLTILDLSNFNTTRVTTMERMFNSCSGLTTLDISNFNTSGVTTMKEMFSSCSKLKTIYVNKSTAMWPNNITNVTTDTSSKYYQIFRSCGTSTVTRK